LYVRWPFARPGFQGYLGRATELQTSDL